MKGRLFVAVQPNLERPLEKGKLGVYVPAIRAVPAIPVSQGAAMVGSYDEEALRIRVDYEGEDAAAGPTRFEQRVVALAIRHMERHPSVLRSWVREDDLVRVGTYDPNTGKIEWVPGSSVRSALQSWLGGSPMEKGE